MRLQLCHIFLPHLVADKLLLQGVVDVYRLSHDEQAAGAHVQPVSHHRTGIALLHDGVDGIVLYAPGRRQHAAGLVDDDDGIILIDRRQLHVLETQRLRVGVDLQPLQHPCQNGFALAPAGWVVVQMPAQLGPGGSPPPELRHADRFQPLPVGILQQLGRTAVARTARRQRIALQQSRTVIIGLPQLHQVLALAAGIEHLVLVEQPQLQLLRHLLGDERRMGTGQRNLPLHGLEMTVGLLGVEHRRHEIVPVVAPGQQSAIRRQESAAPPCGVLHHQHAEHLAPVGILPDNVVPSHIALHLVCRQPAQRMWLVGKRIGEPRRWRKGGM